jgi:hypothetical protein
MPTLFELKTLYKKGEGTHNMTPLLKTTGWYVWTDKTKDSLSVWALNFYDGYADWGYHDQYPYDRRVFAVRSRR